MKKSDSQIAHGTSLTFEKGASGPTSREKLLQSAEALFSAKGFREVTVREIAGHAGVNSALVGYYFGGKQELFEEVFSGHAVPLAEERMRRLNAITKNGRKPSVEEILKAWLLPWLQIGNNARSGAVHFRVTANLSHQRWKYAKEPSEYMKQGHKAFVEALRSCLPHLSTETLMWRLHFVIGALVFGIQQPASLIALSGGRCDPNNLEETFDQILPYAIAGFQVHEPIRTRRSSPSSSLKIEAEKMHGNAE